MARAGRTTVGVITQRTWRRPPGYLVPYVKLILRGMWTEYNPPRQETDVLKTWELGQ